MELVGGRTLEGIIESGTAYVTMFVQSRCTMVVRVCCYVELIGRRGIIKAERAFGLPAMAHKNQQVQTNLSRHYCRVVQLFLHPSISGSNNAFKGRNEDDI